MRHHSKRIACVATLATAVAMLSACNPNRDTTPPRADTAQAPRAQSDQPAANALSDTAITARVKSALVADPDVKGTAITVDTKNGVVALSGNVAGQAARAKAVAVARGVDGVRDVNDALAVN